jgi:hypothetical protein
MKNQESDTFYFEGLFIIALNRPEHLSNDELSLIRNQAHERLTRKGYRPSQALAYVIQKTAEKYDYLLEEANAADKIMAARIQKILSNTPKPASHTHQPDQCRAPEASIPHLSPTNAHTPPPPTTSPIDLQLSLLL